MYAYRIRCEHLAGCSLVEQEQTVEFDAQGVSGPLSEALADCLTNNPAFVVYDTVEVPDPVEEPASGTELLDEPAEADEGVPLPAMGTLPPAEESAFLRWYSQTTPEQKERFIETENLRRDELLRVSAEETRQGRGHPTVMAAVAAALFRLRKRVTQLWTTKDTL